MPAVHRHRTVDDVRALRREDSAWPRYELMDGELLVTPAPSPLHQRLAFANCHVIQEWLDRHPVGVAYLSPADLQLHPGTVTQPDVFVIPAETTPRGDRLEWSDISRLLLAIEVLSPTFQRTDRVGQRDFYLESGVAEDWIVVPTLRWWKRGAQGRSGLDCTTTCWCGCRLERRSRPA
jgi:Uma2 family endonuclease